MNIIKRLKAPTPKFFNTLAKLGVGLMACATTLIAVPSLPPMITTIAGYILTAGIVVTAVSKLSVINEPDNTENK